MVRRASSARVSEQGDFGAVSGENRATTEASGRCRDARTDSSESGARAERERSECGARDRAKAELVAPQFSSLLSTSCRQECDAARQCGFLLVVPFFFSWSLLYYWFVEHCLRERANRAISGANGADESERSDGPNERSVRSDGWMEQMERVAPPFRCVLSSSPYRRAGGGVAMWNLLSPTDAPRSDQHFPIFLLYFRF